MCNRHQQAVPHKQKHVNPVWHTGLQMFVSASKPWEWSWLWFNLEHREEYAISLWMQCCADIDELGTLLPLATGLKSQGVKCFSTLAFAIGTPQTEPSDRRCEELAGRVFGTEPTLGQISSLRCLHFEAPTLIVATLMKSDSTDPGSLVKNLRQVLSAALALTYPCTYLET